MITFICNDCGKDVTIDMHDTVREVSGHCVCENCFHLDRWLNAECELCENVVGGNNVLDAATVHLGDIFPSGFICYTCADKTLHFDVQGHLAAQEARYRAYRHLSS